MNRRGQTLVFLIILIPLFIIAFALTIDVGVAYSKKLKLINTSKDVIRETFYLEDYLEEGRELFEKNDIEISNLKIMKNDNVMILKNNYEIDSIFGKIIGFKTYKLKVSLKAYEKEGELIIVKE